jgi:hypothetical protein
MHELHVSKDIYKNLKMMKGEKEVAAWKVAVHLCLTLIIKDFKLNVEQDRVVTTLNIMFSVVLFHYHHVNPSI